MIICGECGSHNSEGVAFCGDCGTYLEWDGERAAAPPDPAPIPEPEPTPRASGPGFLDRVKSVLGPEQTSARPHEDRAAPVDAPAAGVPAAGVPASGVPAGGVSTAGASAMDLRGSAEAPIDHVPVPEPSAPETSPSAGVARLVVPVVPPGEGSRARSLEREAPPVGPAASGSGPRGQARSPAPVLPGVAVPRPRPPKPPPPNEAPPAPGDLICGSCGAGNVPSRKFCRRCGSDLAEAPVVPPRSWWQRLVRPERRPEPLAGHRPKARRRRRLRPVLLLLVLVAAAAAVFGRGLLVRAADPVLDRVRGTQLVDPVSLSASSADPAHPAALVRDGATNRAWQPAKTGSGEGEFVEAAFEPPVRLVYLGVFSGAAEDPTAFLAQGRPQRVRLTFTRTQDRLEVQEVVLRDQPGRQLLHVTVSDVQSVRLTVLSSQGVRANRRLALGEVEFLARG